MDLKSKKTISYRGGMYLLLALLTISLISGFIIYRFSLLSHIKVSDTTLIDEVIFYGIIGLALATVVVALLLAVRINRNIKSLERVATAMENGADIESMPEFARDELGDISRHIINLYGRLRIASESVEREHDKALHEEQEKLRIKRQLTNNINHELKTPVAAIQGYLETMITSKDMTDQERAKFIEKSYAHCQRLTQLLTDVSTITRLEDGSSRIEKESIDLRAIIDDIASEVALLGDDKRMRMNIDMPESLPVNGNYTLLTSIIKNLTDNAIAYSGGRDIYIKLVGSENGMYTITFADNGIGIDEDHIAHIFERFYRIDAGRSRKLGGTGLGLSIVKNSVLFHGGDISVKNRKVGGLEFTFTLPKAKGETAEISN
ncbi:MAG: sensor histidine kinase [Alistipes sp.]|nr:sensor histidine kinase [Alistipes sp.]